jgi:hypothetical protein
MTSTSRLPSPSFDFSILAAANCHATSKQDRATVLPFWIFDFRIRICFGFRHSDFGFTPEAPSNVTPTDAADRQQDQQREDEHASDQESRQRDQGLTGGG